MRAHLTSFLKSLVSVSGISGYEANVAAIIEKQWRALADETSRSRLGSLQARKHGSGTQPRPAVLIAAHMDAVGMIVSGIEGECLRIAEIGGLDPRVLPGTPVIVHGRRELPGVISFWPPRRLPSASRDQAVLLEDLLVDTGLSHGEVARTIRVGDLISFGTEPAEMAGDVLTGHSLDNRASVAALTICLEALKAKALVWDVWAVATTQEEINYGGAATSSFGLHPQIAVALDTTYAKAPGVDGWDTFGLGEGPTIGVGPNIHPFLRKQLTRLAVELQIPYSLEPMPTSSGTDAMAMQVTAAGMPTIVMSIPIRYMHTATEMVALNDIQRAGLLLAAFVEMLDEGFLQRLVWDD